MMTPQQLKNSILQRAIEGKLVEQRPEEGSANELLKQIKAEKDRLVKEGKIKKSKPLPPITEEEIPFDIPESWEWVRLGDLCSKVGSGNTPSGGRNSDVYKAEGIPFIREQNVHNDGLNYKGIVYISEDLSITRQGSKVYAKDLLLNITGGSIGRCAIVPDEFIVGDINQHILIIRLINECFGKFIHSYICSPLGQSIINNKAVGAKAGFSAEKCKKMVVALPPLSEQHRIVAKIEELLPLVDEYDKAYSQLTALNEKFPADMKKSILQYAIEGKLVEQRPEEGTASDLLKQIKAEKAKLIKEGKIKKEKPLPPITEDEIPFDIPESWEWCRLGDLSALITKGTTPKGGKSAYVDSGVGFLRAENIAGFDCLDLTGLKYVTEENHNGYLRRSIVEAKDFLITIAGTLGRTGIVEENQLPLNANQAISIVRLLDCSKINLKYLVYVVNSPMLHEVLIKQKKITAIPNLTLEIINNMIIPLPPLAEQKRVVERIEQLLPLCDELVLDEG